MTYRDTCMTYLDTVLWRATARYRIVNGPACGIHERDYAHHDARSPTNGLSSGVGPVPTGRALDRHLIGWWEPALRLLRGNHYDDAYEGRSILDRTHAA